jgi:hypothetical protein
MGTIDGILVGGTTGCGVGLREGGLVGILLGRAVIGALVLTGAGVTFNSGSSKMNTFKNVGINNE